MTNDRSAEIRRWIDRLRTGDETARAELLRAAGDRLDRLARKLLRDSPRLRRWTDTDDIFQAGALRLWRRLEQQTPESALHFFRLAAQEIRRELIDLARHVYGPEGFGAHHHSDPAAGAAQPLPVNDPADGTHEPARLVFWTEFHQRVEGLPDDQREVFDLLWYQELTQTEAAELLGVSEREVRRRWRAAKLKLRQALPVALPED